MNMAEAVDVVREVFVMALLISGPILVTGLLIGLVVSLFQAVTQIQEQTLSFVPKIVGMAVAAIALTPWIGLQIMEFAERMFTA